MSRVFDVCVTNYNKILYTYNIQFLDFIFQIKIPIISLVFITQTFYLSIVYYYEFLISVRLPIVQDNCHGKLTVRDPHTNLFQMSCQRTYSGDATSAQRISTPHSALFRKSTPVRNNYWQTSNTRLNIASFVTMSFDSVDCYYWFDSNCFGVDPQLSLTDAALALHLRADIVSILCLRWHDADTRKSGRSLIALNSTNERHSGPQVC